ncbi:hypothetical protein MHYP_G00349300 [Metynnis hypsauchen]
MLCFYTYLHTSHLLPITCVLPSLKESQCMKISKGRAEAGKPGRYRHTRLLPLLCVCVPVPCVGEEKKRRGLPQIHLQNPGMSPPPLQSQ